MENLSSFKTLEFHEMEEIEGGDRDGAGGLACGLTAIFMLTGAEPLAVFTGIGCYAYVMSKS
jgi:hypothetical protein